MYECRLTFAKVGLPPQLDVTAGVAAADAAVAEELLSIDPSAALVAEPVIVAASILSSFSCGNITQTGQNSTKE